MNIFDGLILDIILISFPILLYTLYEAYRKNIGQDEKILFLDFALLSSFYLILKFGYSIEKVMLLNFNVILILALIRNRKIVSFICIGYSIFHYKYFFDFNLYLLLFEYGLYIILYVFKTKNKISNNILLNAFMILKSSFFALQLLLLNTIKLPSNLFILVIILVFYSVTYLSIILFDMGEEVIKYHLNIKELEQEKQIRMSLFKITHEIKNPIAVCKGYLDMFDVNNISHSKKYVPILKEEINRTLILLEDFLCFTKVKVEKELMDITLLLEEVTDNFELMFKEKNIEFNLNLPDDELYIMGDYNRLTQVMINLIKNSIESIENNGKISVECLDKDDKVYVVVSDNGKGIKEEDLEKLKQPFFTTKQNGTGLGVCLSREIIKAHNGTISYKSKESVGTKVTIKLKKVIN
ncbi:MAG: HAMP domain-containing histidine kinase [Bacilli bacterium]|nr:HAMP domain-containing histidine kinase [Bacilli bacterium]